MPSYFYCTKYLGASTAKGDLKSITHASKNEAFVIPTFNGEFF